MSPIRIAFIGLSAASGWAKNAHFPYLKQSSKYKIVGLLNSSSESSKAAIQEFGLSEDTAIYTSSEDLANKSESFDLVVCTVRVDRHYEALRHVVSQRKSCYVEWPFCRNLDEARNLNASIKTTGDPRTFVGLQARRATIVNKVKQLIAEGAIGRILSSSIVASAGNLGQVDGERMGRIFNDNQIQCTMLTIHFGHMIDYVLYATDQRIGSLSASLTTQRKEVQLKLFDGSLESDKRDTPDNIMFQSKLMSGGVLSIHLRGGNPFRDTPGLVWKIHGERGEIELTAAGCFLQVGYPQMSIKLHDHATDTVREIDWEVKDEAESLPMPARNIARLYEAFADGRHDEYVDWDEAIGRKQILEKMMESSETGSWVSI